MPFEYLGMAYSGKWNSFLKVMQLLSSRDWNPRPLTVSEAFSFPAFLTNWAPGASFRSQFFQGGPGSGVILGWFKCITLIAHLVSIIIITSNSTPDHHSLDPGGGGTPAFYHLTYTLAVWSWASCFTSLILHFLIRTTRWLPTPKSCPKDPVIMPM